MIKKRRLVLIIIVSLLLLCGCRKNLIQEKDLDYISFKPNAFLGTEVQTFGSDDKDQGQYPYMTDLLQYALSQPVITDHQNTGDFMINLVYKDQTVRTFYLDIDLQDQKAFLTEGEKCYSIDSEKYDELLVSEVFNPQLNQEFHGPKLNLLLNDDQLPYIGSGTFYYRSFNHTKKELPYKTSETTADEILVNSSSVAYTINYTLDQQPSEIIENIYKDGKLLQSSPLTEQTIILPTEEGHFTIELVCNWQNITEDYFEGAATYQFFLSNDLPVTFSVTQETAFPGDCFVITAENVNEGQLLKVSAAFYKEEVTFMPYKDYFIAILPIYAWVDPQKYMLTTSTYEPLTDQDVASEHPVEVAYKFFDIQYLTVSADTFAIRSQENIESDTSFLKEARSNSKPEKLWNGAFIQPVEGVITTEYSDTRYTNDDPVPSRHSGIDIANKLGTPIKASNTGYVTMAMSLYLTGNTVIIDHGMGIFTAYCHLDEISVDKGALVQKGDIVGKMGTTGFSTGSHLHFTFYINGTYVNPWTFFEQDLLDF